MEAPDEEHGYVLDRLGAWSEREESASSRSTPRPTSRYSTAAASSHSISMALQAARWHFAKTRRISLSRRQSASSRSSRRLTATTWWMPIRRSRLLCARRAKLGLRRSRFAVMPMANGAHRYSPRSATPTSSGLFAFSIPTRSCCRGTCSKAAGCSKDDRGFHSFPDAKTSSAMSCGMTIARWSPAEVERMTKCGVTTSGSKSPYVEQKGLFWSEGQEKQPIDNSPGCLRSASQKKVAGFKHVSQAAADAQQDWPLSSII